MQALIVRVLVLVFTLLGGVFIVIFVNFMSLAPLELPEGAASTTFHLFGTLYTSEEVLFVKELLHFPEVSIRRVWLLEGRIIRVQLLSPTDLRQLLDDSFSDFDLILQLEVLSDQALQLLSKTGHKSDLYGFNLIRLVLVHVSLELVLLPILGELYRLYLVLETSNCHLRYLELLSELPYLLHHLLSLLVVVQASLSDHRVLSKQFVCYGLVLSICLME